MSIVLLAAVYGTLVGGNLVGAPKVVSCDGYWRGTAHLTEMQANALGYFAVVDEAPACADNEYAVATGWQMQDGKIVRQYSKQLRPVAVPRYSVADLFYWCKLHGKDEAVDAALKSAGWYTVAITTQVVEAGNETFAAVVAAVKQSGILTDDEVREALAYAVCD